MLRRSYRRGLEGLWAVAMVAIGVSVADESWWFIAVVALTAGVVTALVPLERTRDRTGADR